ncbi:MAG: glycosyltransferase [Crocinitomicaceae bacterium]|nr:glycosyltransferase [Crocinitomicaceae bacterium]
MAEIAVLLPNYNNAPYLKEAVDSILNQSFQDFIIYFIDDASTDDSIEIINGYNDDRIKVFQKETNSGIVDTMNVGLNEITEKYLIRMDGDDISAPNRFQILYDFMETNLDIDVCSSAIKMFGNIEETIRYEKDIDLNKASLIFSHKIGHAASIVRVSILRELKVKYRNDFQKMEDYDLFYQLRKKARMTAIDDELYFYRKLDYNHKRDLYWEKLKVFQEFYKMILADLEIEPSDKNSEIHLHFSQRIPPKYQFKDYLNHKNLILTKNKKLKEFPEIGLSKVIEEKFSALIFRLIDAKKISIGQLLKISISKPKFFYYYLRRLGKKSNPNEVNNNVS